MKKPLSLLFRSFKMPIFLMLPAALIVSFSTSSQAIDRNELAAIIKAIPPNGPFWKYGNVIMSRRTKKADMAPAVFAHWSHRAQYACRVCHVDLGISMRSGDTGITRAQYLSGKYCGACHDGRMAFSVYDSSGCEKCHMKEKELAALEKQFESFASRMPLSNFGNGIDWAGSIRNGAVEPKRSIYSDKTPMPFPEKLRSPMKLGTTIARSDVAFSHEEHFAELDCANCHPEIFSIKKKGTDDFSMDKNIYGNFCGACHMLVAFPMNDCKRCHPQMSTFSGA